MIPSTFPQRLNFRGADPRCEKELRDELTKLEADWPGIQPQSVTCVHLEVGTHGRTNNMQSGRFAPGEEVEVSKRDMADLDAWVKYLRANDNAIRPDLRRWVEMHPAAYTIEHEFGHVLHGHLYGEIQGDTPVAAKYAKIGMVACGAAPADLSGEIIVMGWGMFGCGANVLAEDLSPYGATHPCEMLAEAFAIDRQEPGRSKAATAIMAQIRKDYHKKFGTPEAA